MCFTNPKESYYWFAIMKDRQKKMTFRSVTNCSLIIVMIITTTCA